MIYIFFNLGECACPPTNLIPHVTVPVHVCWPHSKDRENHPQINSQSGLEWNMSRWDWSPGQSFPALRLPITLNTHSDARTACLPPERRRDRKTKVVRTDKCVVMFMGLEKPVAFPDNPCQVCVLCSFQPSVCLTPSFSLSHSQFCKYILRFCLAYVVARLSGGL